MTANGKTRRDHSRKSSHRFESDSVDSSTSSSGGESDIDDRSCVSDDSSYFSGHDVVELEMFERKCKMLEAVYEKYNSMIKYMCSVMVSQLTSLQKVMSLVAPSVDMNTSSSFDELISSGRDAQNAQTAGSVVDEKNNEIKVERE